MSYDPIDSLEIEMHLRPTKLQRTTSILTRLRMTAALTAFLLTGACVSVNLGQGKAERSKGVQYTAPGGDFKPLSDTRADGAWQSKSTGNSVSYHSICNDPADPTLEIVSRELFSEMTDLKTIRSATTTFNGREALDMEIEGKVEGVPTRIHSMVFKRNDCIYTLTYIGLPKNYDGERANFANFLRSFQAP